MSIAPTKQFFILFPTYAPSFLLVDPLCIHLKESVMWFSQKNIKELLKMVQIKKS